MSTAFSRRVRKRKLKSDINVVPYIDVMLVLLVIFMITAPLLNLGTDINLPQSNAQALENKKDPVLVTVDKDGGYQLRLSADQGLERVDLATMGLRLKALADANPELAVILAGDTEVPYGRVSQAMDYISAAGITHITLLGKPPESGKPGKR
jgi:biopolymer transport protein TolR